MRKLLSVILLLSFNSYAGAPLGVQGQSGSTNYPPVVKVPYNQNTVVAGGSLIDTGNENMLLNPNFEAPTLSGWTCTTGTCTVESTVFSSGKQSAKIVPAANIFDFSQQINTPANIQKQGVVGIIYNFPATCTTTSVQTIVDGTAQSTVPTTSLILDGAFHSIEIPTTFGATSAKIRAFSTATCTGNIYLDKAYISQGLGTQNLMLDNVYSAQVSASGVVTGENKDWINSNCTMSSGISTCTFNTGIFTVAPICTAINIETATNRYVNNLPVSVIGVTTQLYNSAGTGTNTAYQITCQKSGNDYLASSANVYASQNANYDWTSYTPTFTGIGTTAPTTNQCKHRRVGGDLEVSCSFNTGTTAASLFSISLPNSLAIDTSRITTIGNSTASPGQFFGDYIQNGAGTVGHIVTAPLTSTTLLYAGTVNNAVGQITPANGNATLNSSVLTNISFKIPIAGWSNSNVIVGSFGGYNAVPGYQGNVDTFSVSYGTTNATTACTASPCSYLDQIGNIVSSVTIAGTGTYSLVLSRTYSKLKCAMNPSNAVSGTSIANVNLTCSSCNTLPFNTYNSATGALASTYGTFMCQGSY